MVAFAGYAAAQPVCTFRVKVGIDRESVDSLGGRERVVRLIEDMFLRINRAFTMGACALSMISGLTGTLSTSTTAYRPTRSGSPIPTMTTSW